MALLTVEDIESITPDMTVDERESLIESAEAIAAHYAPCLRVSEVPEHIAAVAKAIIKKAIEYDVKAGESGANIRQHEQLGPYGATNFGPRTSGTLFSPAQIEVLRSLCGNGVGGAYSVSLDIPDTLPRW